MKAILVIDMPESCDDCQLAYDYRCFITWKEFEEKEEDYIITYPRPTWCPLKPIPIKKEALIGMGKINFGKALGWNACLKEIENESRMD